jgi:hypothetical protein
MTKFAVLIHGVNFSIQENPNEAAELRGFYVSAFVEADSAERAESEAIDLVRKSLRPRVTLTNLDNNPPRLLVDEVAELTDWPERCSRPLSGFAFYNESDEAEDMKSQRE